MTERYSIVTYNIAAYCCFQLEGRLKRKEPEEQKIKEEVDEKVQVNFQEFLIYCYYTHGVTYKKIKGERVLYFTNVLLQGYC